jgi:hypothetical protein
MNRPNRVAMVARVASASREADMSESGEVEHAAARAVTQVMT